MPLMISIIIPVFKEPEINTVGSNVVGQNYPDFEILVIDGEESGMIAARYEAGCAKTTCLKVQNS